MAALTRVGGSIDITRAVDGAVVLDAPPPTGDAADLVEVCLWDVAGRLADTLPLPGGLAPGGLAPSPPTPSLPVSTLDRLARDGRARRADRPPSPRSLRDYGRRSRADARRAKASPAADGGETSGLLPNPTVTAAYGACGAPDAAAPTIPVPVPCIPPQVGAAQAPTPAAPHGSAVGRAGPVPPPPRFPPPPIPLLYAVVLASEAARGVALPTQVPLLAAVGGSRADVGLLAAAFCAAAAAATVPLGVVADAAPVAVVLAACMGAAAAGHVATAASSSAAALVAARAVTGAASATAPLARAAVVAAAASAAAAAGGGPGGGAAAAHLAGLSATGWAGAAVLPGVAGGVLAALPSVGGVYLGLAALNALVVAALLGGRWGGVPRGGAPPPANKVPAAAAVAAPTAAPGPTVPGATSTPATVVAVPPTAGGGARPPGRPLSSTLLVLGVCLLLNAVFNGVIGALEAVATPFLVDAYGLTTAGASGLVSVIGVVGLVAYVAVAAGAHRVRARTLVVAGLGAAAGGAAVLSAPAAWALARPWGVVSPPPSLPVGAYVAALGLLWAVAFPVGQTATLSLYAAALARLPPGTAMAVFATCGLGARGAAALAAAWVWQVAGREAVFVGLLGVVLSVAGMVAAVYDRLLVA